MAQWYLPQAVEGLQMRPSLQRARWSQSGGQCRAQELASIAVIARLASAVSGCERALATFMGNCASQTYQNGVVARVLCADVCTTFDHLFR